MLKFKEIETALDQMNYHTLADAPPDVDHVLLACRGATNIERWTQILCLAPGYPLEGTNIPIALWFFMRYDVRYDIIVRTIGFEQQSKDPHLGACMLL